MFFHKLVKFVQGAVRQQHLAQRAGMGVERIAEIYIDFDGLWAFDFVHGDRNIDGIPALMVMGEYEWMDERLAPTFKFLAAHPATPIAVLAEPGRGHFDCSDDLVKFLALFIRKSIEA